ncbi:MAG: alpha-galactosidase [Clostridia bacterium]|nr:alpha-galactosidase [Clostridia bacterium]
MTIHILYQDGTPVPHTSAVEKNGITVTHTAENAVHTVILTARKAGICPEALEVSFPIPTHLLEPLDQLYFYDDNAHTNDITGVYPYAENSTREIPQLAVFKNLAHGSVWLAGLCTMHRFWSAIFLKDDTLTFRFELEGRELSVGEPYIMERFMVSEGDPNGENALLEAYADAIEELNGCIPTGDLPVGWCSWSCYYGDVDEEKIRRAADMQVRYAAEGRPNLIQIDDGWQRCGSFCGEWVTREDKFPSGMPALAKYVNDRGMTFGLWLAPLMLDDQSDYYDSLKHMGMPDSTMGDPRYHPFNLGHPDYHDHLRRTFRHMVDDFGARYFKLDFLAASVRFFNDRGGFVRFGGGYCIELLRNALKVIRETVGDDVFLLACGAQTLLGAGIFNGARMSCDIIWGKNKDLPSYWEIMKNCLHTVGWRYFYHRKAYINDPDGLVLRDWDRGDGFNCTYAEAELWAVAIAMSGGSVLSNDELENLSPARRRLYTELLPPLDIPARPVDYFQRPEPTAYILDVDENTKFLALYHFGDKMEHLEFDLDKVGMKGALVANCLDHRFLGFRDSIRIDNANPHSGAMFLLRRPAAEPAFVGSDANIYMGVNLFSSTFEGGKLTVNRPETHKDAVVYVLWPEGYEATGKEIWKENGFTLTENP